MGGMHSCLIGNRTVLKTIYFFSNALRLNCGKMLFEFISFNYALIPFKCRFAWTEELTQCPSRAVTSAFAWNVQKHYEFAQCAEERSTKLCEYTHLDTHKFLLK